MIKELLLSLAVAAFSGVSSFVGSPKRAVDWNEYDGFNATITYLGLGGASEFSGEFYSGQRQISLTFDAGGSFSIGDWVTIGQYEDRDRFWFGGYWKMSNGQYHFQFNLNFYLETNNWQKDVEKIDELETSAENTGNYPISNLSFTTSTVDEGPYEEDGEYYYAKYFETTFSSSGLEQGAGFTAGWSEPQPQETYTITKNLYNCSINSMPELPNTYQSAAVGQTFVIYGAANSDLAGDYGFNSQSLSVTGASATALSLTNEIGNTGYYRGCSFSVTLPANSFTISLTAYRPSFSITLTLNNCTVSPEIQSSYSGMFAEDFTFTAERGFYFNKNVDQWEFTGGVVAQEPEYIGFVWGTLYESVKIRLVFDAGNATIRVSGVAYTIDSYQQGWKDGDKSGYDRGHADGLIAGDSYGVWNWLKQAARTTGEFLSINLLPGFSIGALLTALAGLMIIWLFIKGFLFKS